MGRWFGSAAGTNAITDRRLHVGLRAWAATVVDVVIGPLLTFSAGAVAVLVAMWRPRIPPIVAIPIAYMLVAVAASFVIRLKEPRFLIAIVPMAALTIALLIDWDLVWARIRHPA